MLSMSDYVPDIIRGDLDSIRPDVLEYYSKLGTQYVLTLPSSRVADCMS